MITKTRTPKPLPREITYDRVRALVTKHADEHRGGWLSVLGVIDLMNGWDGGSTWGNASLSRARKKLRNFPGTTDHETATSSQMSATRRQLDKLAEEKLVEKERGHTDGNNSWGYRWITDALKTKKANRATAFAQAKELARRLSLALGGDGTSGTQPFLTPDETVGVRVNLYGTTAEQLLALIEHVGVGPDFFKGKNAVPWPPSRGPCPECVEYGSCAVHPETR